MPGGRMRSGRRTFKDVVESDGIFAVVNGAPPDEGVMVELGMAIALGKPTFLFRDDFRQCNRQRRVSPEPDAVHGDAARRGGGTTTIRR